MFFFEFSLVSLFSLPLSSSLLYTCYDAHNRMDEARDCFHVCDIDGVLGAGRRGQGKAPPLTEDQLVFAKSDHTVGMTIEEIVKEVKPSVLIGASNKKNFFFFFSIFSIFFFFRFCLTFYF